ncbi:hypothetical protein ACFOSC_17945 [Streptantibioticus rubrisoli]|uniref:Uncharacterized protein n=1 Tax=Streptantibioticus rubrisoli TaxID=1387313 RepID=A0ABT1PH43_9ACTN|nr:hypothetical protein [Streptantibioticus rubrisoli]MCQ4044681.1 hypothetical protein [Streptantibioticus rubrisoli]
MAAFQASIERRGKKVPADEPKKKAAAKKAAAKKTTAKKASSRKPPRSA